MSIPIELLKGAGTIGGIWIGGYLALDRLIEEGRQASDRLVQAAQVQSERETQIELVKRFITNPNDLDDVFRTMTLLVRTGFLPDRQGHLKREIKRHFGQDHDQIDLAVITTATRVTARVPASAQPATQPPATHGQPADQSAGAPSGPDWLAQVEALAGSDAAVRRSTAQRLVNAIRADPDLTTTGPLIANLVDQLSDTQIRGLSATGRLNTLVVLGAVSTAQWRRTPAETSDLRANLDALKARADAGQVLIGADTAKAIDAIRRALPP